MAIRSVTKLLYFSKINIKIFLIISLLLLNNSAKALTFDLPNNASNIIGKVYTVYLEPGDSLKELARRHSMGYEELIRANQHINLGKPKAWSKVLIPSSFVLPNTPRKGIVVNLPEMRLYYFPKDSNVVVTYPVGIGRQGWRTPMVSTKIVKKKPNPTWRPPKSIKAHMAKKGVFLPDVVPSGKDNPLGYYALQLQLPRYLIHGTNKPYSIGKRSSSGCIRMYPEHIEKLFHIVDAGEEVHIINQPYKAGWYDGDLYLESHKPFRDQRPNSEFDTFQEAVDYANQTRDITIDWNSADKINKNFTGYPQLIGIEK
jgi:L,D-transpeptidase ErfK/SrfK